MAYNSSNDAQCGKADKDSTLSLAISGSQHQGLSTRLNLDHEQLGMGKVEPRAQIPEPKSKANPQAQTTSSNAVKIILAVDGSAPALAATQAVIDHRVLFNQPMDIHLVYVGAPIPKLYGVKMVVDNAALKRFTKGDADWALLESINLLGKSDLAYKRHNLIGEVAEVINAFASTHLADFIYIGAHGRGSLLSNIRRAMLGSTAVKLLHTAAVPVVVIHTSEI